MADPPGTIPRTQISHPRRPPAHQSVSLRHSPPRDRAHLRKATITRGATSLSPPEAPASDQANPPSTVSPKLATNKQSSGESSDAGKWFESTNNHALQSNASFVDNDPPFFLRNSSSSGTPPEGHGSRHHSTYLPHRPGLTHLGTDGSSTEDFRSVIDDLTVVNKRLKQKLKKYEKMYDAHLQEEKLFEVRFHGLPDHKKRELEETLQKFASSLDDGEEYPPISYAPPLDAQKTVSSTSRFAESGYASMSASGQHSSSITTAPSGADSDRRKISKSQLNRNQQNVHSYLHDIPIGLMPKHNVPMTDKSKKKLVVRRLEQIFAGKRSAPGAHAQPIQQEEVAQSAAMADRRAKEENGQLTKREGHREARIMPVRSEDEDITDRDPMEGFHKYRPALPVIDQDVITGSWSPDQRPTRPLDLDPYRAQVPVENMEYIRHLGFTPPDVATGDAPEDGHGWIYLNLLINMAQLHTINVTPDFVKDAVTEYSSMLELSHDGRKVRWRGGHDASKDSSGSSSEHLSNNSPYGVSGSSSLSPTKYIKTGQSGSTESLDPERLARRTARALKEREMNKYSYTPIFFHKEESDDEDEYYNLDMMSSNNSLQPHQPGDSSGFGSSAMRSSSSKKKREDGPIIFYNKAKFCTDLSGDRHGSSIANPSTYKSVTSQPLGMSAPPPSVTKSINEKRQPGNILDMDVGSKDGDRTTSSSDLDFSPEALDNDNGEDSPEMMDFEASGLGGVQPDDNFQIKVQRSTVRAERSWHAAASRKKQRSQMYSKNILKALTEKTSSEEVPSRSTMIKEEILSASRKDLPSSSLPPASFLPFDSTSSGDVDSDLESDVSSSPSSTESSDRGPATALQLLNISPTHVSPVSPILAHDHDEDDDEEDDDEDSDSDGSVDLLATARKNNPEDVRLREREYDAALAERLAEDIPAGSSAATAGGGSGFNSPMSVTVGEDHQAGNALRSSSGSASTRTRNLKRARTSDSIATVLKNTKTQKTNG